MAELKGKKVIVLGGTSGIGLAAARGLEAAGARVVVGGRSTKNLERARGVLTGDALQVDVQDRQALAALFAAHAPFDHLVNAATGGVRAVGPFLKMDLDGFRNSFDKLWGYVNSVRLGAEHLAQDGSVVLVSGAVARKANPGASAISTVGNAVEGFCRAIAPELAPRRINVVAPGIIDTPMFPMQGEQRDNFLTAATSNALIKRAGSADEVAEAILFLLKNDFVTGTVIDVDGGGLLP